MRGYSLIEVIVVVAVIGVISSIFVTSVSVPARQKGNDASIRSLTSEMRKQASVFLASHGSYGTGTIGNDDSIAECRANFAGSVFHSGTALNFQSIMNSAYQKAPQQRVFCAVQRHSWAFAIPLHRPSTGMTGWCVDSDGSSREVNYNFGAQGNPMLAGGVAKCR